MAGWLLPLAFLLAIPIGVAWGQGVVAVLSAHGGPMLTDLHSFSKLKYLQGLLSDIKCETDIKIFFFPQKNVNFEL